uniref:DUF736 domain-containing protein n=1 Tax=Steinernema glaseri TaxID=37863 RepID=A0A1I7YA28_9BILA
MDVIASSLPAKCTFENVGESCTTKQSSKLATVHNDGWRAVAIMLPWRPSAVFWNRPARQAGFSRSAGICLAVRVRGSHRSDTWPAMSRRRRK